MFKESEVSFLPAGEMGAALAVIAARNGCKPRAWFHSKESFDHFQMIGESPHLEGVPLDGITVKNNIKEAVEGAKVVCFVLRSANFVEVVRNAQFFIDENALLVTGTKGFIEYNGKFNTATQVIEQEIPHSKDRVVALGGPNFADQIARGKLTGTTMAAYNQEAAAQAKEIFHNGTFRVDLYRGKPTDLEIVGAFKNVVGLVMGFARTLEEYDENTGALILQRGLREASILCKAMGGNPNVVMELCGVGDYGLLMNSTTSRNVQAGEAFGRGEKTLNELINSDVTIEGIQTTKAIRWFFKQHRVFLPLALNAYRVLYNGRKPAYAVRRLLQAA